MSNRLSKSDQMIGNESINHLKYPSMCGYKFMKYILPII